MFNSQTIDRLIMGIQSIVSESRSSLSIEEMTLLKECVAFLETVKNANDYNSQSAITIVSSVIQILLRVLLSDDLHKLKDLFF